MSQMITSASIVKLLDLQTLRTMLREIVKLCNVTNTTLRFTSCQEPARSIKKGGFVFSFVSKLSSCLAGRKRERKNRV